jgi:predicted restriction endonuclease
MSQRIAASLEVLDLIREFAQKNPSSSASSWRRDAIARITTSRGVTMNTIFAHLVGKNTRYTLGVKKIDRLIKIWITEGADDLEKWILQSCEHQEGKRVVQFFSSEQSTPFAVDIKEPEPTVKYLATTYRVLRDTALARRIKADNGYKCQICGGQILLSEDKPYAEAHHVKPLGSPHDGPDHLGNIVCVCPNCHVKLDYGAIEINQNIFKNVLPEFIQYHNENIHKKAE